MHLVEIGAQRGSADEARCGDRSSRSMLLDLRGAARASLRRRSRRRRDLEESASAIGAACAAERPTPTAATPIRQRRIEIERRRRAPRSRSDRGARARTCARLAAGWRGDTRRTPDARWRRARPPPVRRPAPADGATSRAEGRLQREPAGASRPASRASTGGAHASALGQRPARGDPAQITPPMAMASASTAAANGSRVAPQAGTDEPIGEQAERRDDARSSRRRRARRVSSAASAHSRASRPRCAAASCAGAPRRRGSTVRSRARANRRRRRPHTRHLHRRGMVAPEPERAESASRCGSPPATAAAVQRRCARRAGGDARRHFLSC